MITFLVAGFVVGAAARLVRLRIEHLDLPATLGLGIVGSLVGGLIARLVGTSGAFELDVIGFVLAVVVAVLFISVADSIAVRNKRVP